jgi:hypothetical protein
VISRLARGGEEIEELGISGISSQLIQIAADYNSLPDLNKITVNQIRFFYEPMINGLIKMQRKEAES